MLFLALAVACSLGIALVFKVAERRDLDRMALLAVNYAVAAVVAAGVQGAGGLPARVPAGAVALGVVQGVLFIGGFWLFSVAIRRAGMGLAAGVMRLSVGVPVVAAWAVWGEAPTAVQGLGLALAAGAFVLVARPPEGAAGGPAAAAPGELGAPSAARDVPAGARGPAGALVGLLGALFLAGGLVDVVNKTYQERYAGAVSEATFLLFVFAVAFAIGAAAVGRTARATGRWPGRDVVGWGVALGVLNFVSTAFLLRALGVLPAPVVFPLNSVAIVLGAAVLGRLLFGERLSRGNAVGLGLAAVAVALLAGGA